MAGEEHKDAAGSFEVNELAIDDESAEDLQVPDRQSDAIAGGQLNAPTPKDRPE